MAESDSQKPGNEEAHLYEAALYEAAFSFLQDRGVSSKKCLLIDYCLQEFVGDIVRVARSKIESVSFAADKNYIQLGDAEKKSPSTSILDIAHDARTDMLSVLLDFKHVGITNDFLGTEFMDSYLEDFVQLFRDKFQSVDKKYGEIFRIGGDEFFLLFSKENEYLYEDLQKGVKKMQEEYKAKAKFALVPEWVKFQSFLLPKKYANAFLNTDSALSKFREFERAVAVKTFLRSIRTNIEKGIERDIEEKIAALEDTSNESSNTQKSEFISEYYSVKSLYDRYSSTLESVFIGKLNQAGCNDAVRKKHEAFFQRKVANFKSSIDSSSADPITISDSAAMANFVKTIANYIFREFSPIIRESDKDLFGVVFAEGDLPDVTQSSLGKVMRACEGFLSAQKVKVAWGHGYSDDRNRRKSDEPYFGEERRKSGKVNVSELSENEEWMSQGENMRKIFEYLSDILDVVDNDNVSEEFKPHLRGLVSQMLLAVDPSVKLHAKDESGEFNAYSLSGVKNFTIEDFFRNDINTLAEKGSFSVLEFDVNLFGAINNTQGYQIADNVLQEAAQIVLDEIIIGGCTPKLVRSGGGFSVIIHIPEGKEKLFSAQFKDPASVKALKDKLHTHWKKYFLAQPSTILEGGEKLAVKAPGFFPSVAFVNKFSVEKKDPIAYENACNITVGNILKRFSS